MRRITLVFLFVIFAGVLMRAQNPPVTDSGANLPALPPDASAPPSGDPSAPAAPAVPNPPPVTPGSGFIYDPTGKRDPFQPEAVESTAPVQPEVVAQPQPQPLAPRELEPLESFDVPQLRVTGIIWDIRKPRAMITDPNGGVHIVYVKTRIGKKNGFVVAIREGEVVVVEYNVELDKWVKSFKVLELR